MCSQYGSGIYTKMKKKMITLRSCCRNLLVMLLLMLVEGRTAQRYGDSYITISTTHGDVMGSKKIVLGNTVYAFLGIPFAQPPTGRLRFQNPQLLSKWKNILSAVRLPNTCYQALPQQFEMNSRAYRMWINNTEMSEDCLYMNIWTPVLPPARSESRRNTGASSNDSSRSSSSSRSRPPNSEIVIPTMVWIHGDNFNSGGTANDVYNGEILASKMNVIVVSIQYRLGPLGFLYLGLSDVPGNQGLMDQVMALAWININIQNFGGQKEYITIFGSQSGAVSAGLHLVSPLTKKLFNQAVLQSGSPLAWWSHDRPEVAADRARDLAWLSGCLDDSTVAISAVAECLRSLEPGTLVRNQRLVHLAMKMRMGGNSRQKLLMEVYKTRMKEIRNSAQFFLDIPFKPVVGTSYLPKPPRYYLTTARGIASIQKRRVMLGFNKNEGLSHLIRGLPYLFLPNNVPSLSDQPPRQFKYSYNANKVSLPPEPIFLMALHLLDESFIQQFLVQTVVFEYQVPGNHMKNVKWTSREVAEALDNIAGDFSFKCPVIEFADLYFRMSKVRMYSFEHEITNLPMPDWTGVGHGQEIPFVFGQPFDSEFQRRYFNFTNQERDLSLRVMKLWTNFAKTGHPNYRLREYNTHQKRYYWDSYKEDSFFIKDRTHLVIRNGTISMERNLRRRQCLFWNKYIPRVRMDMTSSCPPKTKFLEKNMKPGASAHNNRGSANKNRPTVKEPVNPPAKFHPNRPNFNREQSNGDSETINPSAKKSSSLGKAAPISTSMFVASPILAMMVALQSL